MINCLIVHILQRYMLADNEESLQLFDLIEKMLEYDPKTRINLRDAMRHPYFDKLSREEKGYEGKSESRELSR